MSWLVTHPPVSPQPGLERCHQDPGSAVPSLQSRILRKQKARFLSETVDGSNDAGPIACSERWQQPAGSNYTPLNRCDIADRCALAMRHPVQTGDSTTSSTHAGASVQWKPCATNQQFTVCVASTALTLAHLCSGPLALAPGGRQQAPRKIVDVACGKVQGGGVERRIQLSIGGGCVDAEPVHMGGPKQHHLRKGPGKQCQSAGHTAGSVSRGGKAGAVQQGRYSRDGQLARAATG
jgi:hypothetical protein